MFRENKSQPRSSQDLSANCLGFCLSQIGFCLSKIGFCLSKISIR